MPTHNEESFDKGEEKLTGHIGRAIVVNSNDPLHCSRLQLRIADLHSSTDGSGGYEDAELPWAIDMLAKWASHASMGSLRPIPPSGTEVYYIIMDEDGDHIGWLGGAKAGDLLPMELMADYPNCYGEINRSGDLILVNTRTDFKVWYMANGSRLQIDGTGSTMYEVGNSPVAPGASAVLPPGFTLVSPTAVNILAKGKISVKSMVGVDIQPPAVTVPDAPAPRTRPEIAASIGQKDL